MSKVSPFPLYGHRLSHMVKATSCFTELLSSQSLEDGGYFPARILEAQGPDPFVPLEDGIEEDRQPNPTSHIQRWYCWKYVLLVPSSGQSSAELWNRFFTLSWVLSAFVNYFAACLLPWCSACNGFWPHDSGALVVGCLKPSWESERVCTKLQCLKMAEYNFFWGNLCFQRGPFLACTISSWLPIPKRNLCNKYL